MSAPESTGVRFIEGGAAPKKSKKKSKGLQAIGAALSSVVEDLANHDTSPEREGTSNTGTRPSQPLNLPTRRALSPHRGAHVTSHQISPRSAGDASPLALSMPAQSLSPPSSPSPLAASITDESVSGNRNSDATPAESISPEAAGDDAIVSIGSGGAIRRKGSCHTPHAVVTNATFLQPSSLSSSAITATPSSSSSSSSSSPSSPSPPSITSSSSSPASPAMVSSHTAATNTISSHNPHPSPTSAENARFRSSTWSMAKSVADGALDAVGGFFDGQSDFSQRRQSRRQAGFSGSDHEEASNEVGGSSSPPNNLSMSSAPPSSASKDQSKRQSKMTKEQTLLNSLLFTLTPVYEGSIAVKKPHHSSKRRWAILEQTSLYVFKGPRDPRNPLVIALMGACVRLVPFKQTTFQVLASTGTYVITCDSQKELSIWVTRMTNICEQLVLGEIDKPAEGEVPDSQHASEADTAKQQVAELQRDVDGNQRCADCDREDPEWASTNLGVFICIDCSGTHRRLGTHISKVRSIKLDKWQPEHLERLRQLGNKLANEVWEFNLPEGVAKPTPAATLDDRSAYIFQKYQLGSFRKDAELYAAAQRPVTLTGEGLRTAILQLLRVDDDFRNELRALLLGGQTSEAISPLSTRTDSTDEIKREHRRSTRPVSDDVQDARNALPASPNDQTSEPQHRRRRSTRDKTNEVRKEKAIKH